MRLFVVAAMLCSGWNGYAPSPGSCSVTGGPVIPRQFRTATLLVMGRAFLTGGISASGPNAPVLASAELFDPSAGSFTGTGATAVPRASRPATCFRTEEPYWPGAMHRWQVGSLLARPRPRKCMIPSRERSLRRKHDKARSHHLATLTHQDVSTGFLQMVRS
jgi:hypothetical protein